MEKQHEDEIEDLLCDQKVARSEGGRCDAPIRRLQECLALLGMIYFGLKAPQVGLPSLEQGSFNCFDRTCIAEV